MTGPVERAKAPRGPLPGVTARPSVATRIAQGWIQRINDRKISTVDMKGLLSTTIIPLLPNKIDDIAAETRAQLQSALESAISERVDNHAFLAEATAIRKYLNDFTPENTAPDASLVSVSGKTPDETALDRSPVAQRPAIQAPAVEIEDKTQHDPRAAQALHARLQIQVAPPVAPATEEVNLSAEQKPAQQPAPVSVWWKPSTWGWVRALRKSE